MHRLRPLLSTAVLAMVVAAPAAAQGVPGRSAELVPRDVREMYDRGLKYLATTQGETGDWSNTGGESGPGITGLCVMAFLASGEDPNFGLYAGNVRRGLRSIIEAQNADTGFFGHSMYHHGFATLALAEAYGVVDERSLWPEAPKAGSAKPRSIGKALELAVRASITSQKKNSLGAWRYSPDSTDADTSVSGAVMVSLLAARNAGIEVPDEAIDRAVAYFKSMTSSSGHVAYSGGLGGFDESTARSSIGALVYAVARRKDMDEFRNTLGYLKGKLEEENASYPEYTRYYEAQALFQGDVLIWEKWNKLLVRRLKALQRPDGSIPGQNGPVVGTSMSILALALNFKFLPIYER